MKNASDLQAITPLLVALQTSPERDTSLAALAAEHGCSPSHFHRLFKHAVGETPRFHVDRVRLERAAYRLAITRDTVLDIALSVGFQNHETFTRAFRRRFGASPQAWRRSARAGSTDRSALRVSDEGCMLSGVSFLTLRPLVLLSWRRIGPYGTFAPPRFDGAPSEWSPLIDEAAAQRLGFRPLGLVISYDNPFLTPPHLQQLDACVPLIDPHALPSGKTLRRLAFDGGRFGAIEHRGPPDSLIKGYIALVEGIARSGRFRIRDGPPLEILRELSPDGDPMKSLTEIYLPVETV